MFRAGGSHDADALSGGLGGTFRTDHIIVLYTNKKQKLFSTILAFLFIFIENQFNYQSRKNK
jgi:hypothetical protein